MGEVYRAKDTRLGREVARSRSRYCPEHLAGDTAPIERFSCAASSRRRERILD
jgi:hypothetical protein